MLDEYIEVKNYLDGKGMRKKTEYRTCLLLARYFKDGGMTRRETIESIFSWGRANDIDITTRVRDVVNKVYDNDEHINRYKVGVYQSEINEIKQWFDNRSERIVALAMLCCSKAFADENGDFKVSLGGIADWTGYSDVTITNAVKRLKQYEYLDVVTHGDTYSWFNTVKTKCNCYRVIGNVKESGDYYVLEDDDIAGFYEKFF